MAQKKTMKETTELALFLARLASDLTVSLADGHLSVFDGISLVTKHLTSLPNVVDGIHRIPSEVLDMTDEERNELIMQFQEEFNIPFEGAEHLAESALQILVDGSDFVLNFLNLKTS